MNPDISNIHSGFGWILTPRCSPSGAQRGVRIHSEFGSGPRAVPPRGHSAGSRFGQALGNLGPGPVHGPRPGPMGPCPLGPGPARARAHGALPIGPGSGPGPRGLAHWAQWALAHLGVQKSSKKESSQNEVLYSGKCSHTL